MRYDTVIKNGWIVTADGCFSADIGVIGTKIAEIGPHLQGRREVDATGKWVTPGAVDIHVHLDMTLPNGLRSADTFYSGTVAAAHGGTTTIVDFVSTAEGQTLGEALAQRRAEADRDVVIDYGLHITITPQEMGCLEQVAEMVAAGCASFKLYMAYGFRLRDDQLHQALQAIRAVGGRPVIHAENWEVICQLVAEHRAQGALHPRYHPRSRPAEWEAEAVGRAIAIANEVGTPLHIFHVSCGEAVAQIAQARQAGRPISGETCPQYLFGDDSWFEREGVAGCYPVCAPPIREASQQMRLWQALADGHLQVVSTDHCPFFSADKARGLADFSLIPGGVPSIEMRFSALYSAGVRRGLLSAEQWIALCCTTPAELMGLPHKGRLAVGADADIVIFDPHKEVRLSAETLHERAGWTIYEGQTVQGWPTHTFCRGTLLVEEGRLCAERGFGRFLPTQPYHHQ